MIGISSKNAEIGSHWLESLIKKGFRLIELNHRIIEIHFSDKEIRKLREKFKKYNLKVTIHSGVTDLLHKDEIICTYQLNLLKAEIKYAPKLKIKHVTFHLPEYLSHKKDKKKIEKFFSEILKFAKKYKVKLSIENDPDGPWSKPKDFLPYLKKYKSLNHLLDIGHLNKAIHSKLVKSEEDYINQLGKYINYVHLQGNHWIEDEHIGIGSGNLKLNFLLPAIKKLKPEILIIETKNMKEALKSKRILKKYKITS